MTRVDAGHVGIRVKLAGSDRGVQEMPVVTGWVFYNPLTMWVWIGGIVLVIGTLIALLPNKKAPARKRPELETVPEKTGEQKEIEAKVS